MYLKAKNFFEKFVLATSQNEDKARSEFILNILLIAVISLSFFAFIINLVDWLVTSEVAVSVGIIFSILSFFVFLYFLSRKGYAYISSIFLLATLFLLATYEIYKWGVNLPFGILTYVIIIVMAGILVNTRFAFIVTFIISVVLAMLGYLQGVDILSVDRNWIAEIWGVPEIIMTVVILSIIATISWLSNREIEKSLARARRSEAELKKERDSLEVTVEQRTRELKETQAEKMTQLYRFAEFGRLSSGLFHDLINPLTAVSLNIEKIKNTEVSEYVDKAIVAAKKMEDMVNAVRKQLARQETKTLFSVNDEIAQALEVLAHKAQKSGVAIRFFSREPGSRSSATSYSSPSATAKLSLPGREIKTYGDAVKFNQVALNLIANAIDAYLPAVALAKEGLEKRDDDTQTVTMSLSQEGGIVIFEVRDKGVGIPEENKPKLFEPFFTTKKEGYGLGIGLSMIKRIVEKDFDGSISVESKKGEGAVFTVKFSQRNQNG